MNEKRIGRLQTNTEVLQQVSNVAFLLSILAIIQGAFSAVFWVGIVLLVIAVVSMLVSATLQRVQWQRLLERLAIMGMIVGLVGMFQSWQISFYENGFYILGISTLAFIIISHVPSPQTE